MIRPGPDGAAECLASEWSGALVEEYSWCRCTDLGIALTSTYEVRSYGWLLRCHDCDAETFVFLLSWEEVIRRDQTRQSEPVPACSAPTLDFGE